MYQRCLIVLLVCSSLLLAGCVSFNSSAKDNYAEKVWQWGFYTDTECYITVSSASQFEFRREYFQLPRPKNLSITDVSLWTVYEFIWKDVEPVLTNSQKLTEPEEALLLRKYAYFISNLGKEDAGLINAFIYHKTNKTVKELLASKLSKSRYVFYTQLANTFSVPLSVKTTPISNALILSMQSKREIKQEDLQAAILLTIKKKDGDVTTAKSNP